MAKKKSVKKKSTRGRKKKISVDRLAATFVTVILFLGFIFFGGEYAGFQFDGLFPQVKDKVESVSEGISTVEQDGSGLYFYDGSPLEGYSGSQVVEVNGDEPFFTVEEINSIYQGITYQYAGNDVYGRAGVATAVLDSSSLISSEGRPSLPDPVGWVGRSQGGIYDRSHLIAYTFGGSNDVDNLVTGTISFNQKYMVEIENSVRDYVKNSSKPFLYRVSPFYRGSELLPVGVLMEGRSAEGDYQFNRFVYNVQDGYLIDYETGSVTELE